MDPAPLMVVVAGPPGSGKSTHFPASSFDIEWFSIDDRCAEELGSYVGIPPEARARISRECERFVEAHIAARLSFATETTLRTDAAIRQAAAEKAQRFDTYMIFVSTADAETALERVRRRGRSGGHSAPSDVVRTTFTASLAQLAAAIRVFDRVDCYDSTADFAPPRLVAEFEGGGLVTQSRPNAALRGALAGLLE